MRKPYPLIWVARRIRKRIPAIALMILSYMFNALLVVAFSLGTSQVIDSAVSADWAAFGRACVVQGCIILGILLTLTFNHHIHDKLLALLDRDWKKQLFHGLIHGDYADVAAYHSGELVNRLTNDVRVLNTSLLTTLPNLASMITKLVAAIAVLVSLEPLFTVLFLAAGAVVILITGSLRPTLKRLQKQVSAEDGRVSGFLQEILGKLLMVQAMDVTQQIEDRAADMMQQRYKAQRKRKNFSLLANSCVNLLSYGANFAALVWCSVGLFQGVMTFGTLTAIMQLVSQLQAPLVNLSGMIPQYIAMIAAAERLMELEQISGEPEQEKADPVSLYRDMRGIGAKDLCFSYDRDPVFREAEFFLPKGQFGVITGHSGIGKSTLLKLMLGIFHPEGGSLYADTGHGPVALNRSTRGLFAYVPQGNLLISGTLRENLIITRPDATKAEIERAIYLSGMDAFLPSLPQGLDTPLGESAAGLSEGQAQRLSIARAVLSQAPVLLLDEATSALDEETEATVLHRLLEEGKTCIAVTHRPAAVALSHWSLEIQDGKCTVTE